MGIIRMCKGQVGIMVVVLRDIMEMDSRRLRRMMKCTIIQSRISIRAGMGKVIIRMELISIKEVIRRQVTAMDVRVHKAW